MIRSVGRLDNLVHGKLAMQVGSSAESRQKVAIWKSPHRDSGRGLSLGERIRTSENVNP